MLIFQIEESEEKGNCKYIVNGIKNVYLLLIKFSELIKSSIRNSKTHGLIPLQCWFDKDGSNYESFNISFLSIGLSKFLGSNWINAKHIELDWKFTVFL